MNRLLKDSLTVTAYVLYLLALLFLSPLVLLALGWWIRFLSEYM